MSVNHSADDELQQSGKVWQNVTYAGQSPVYSCLFLSADHSDDKGSEVQTKSGTDNIGRKPTRNI